MPGAIVAAAVSAAASVVFNVAAGATFGTLFMKHLAILAFTGKSGRQQIDPLAWRSSACR